MSKQSIKNEAEPRVGIFWLYKGTVLSNSSPLSKAEPYGDSLGHATSHIDYWAKLQQSHAVAPEIEYEEFPRGRVLFDKRAERFVLYADKCILSKEMVVRDILKQFHLPKTAKRGIDPHYRCSKCLYGAAERDEDFE